MSSRITTTGGVLLSVLQSSMTSVGVTVTGVALTTPPVLATIAAPPSPPMPPSPSPSPPPPYGCGVVYQCAAGVSCANLEGCGPCPVGQLGDGRTCTPCMLSVAVTNNVAGGSLTRSTETTLSGVASTNTSCTTAGGFVFSWVANALDSAGAQLAPVATTPSLTLLARSLAVQASASFTLTACFAGARTLCASSAPVAFAVTATPLIAVIGGGGGVVGETPVVLSAARSSDPDGAALSSFTFSWSCVRTDVNNPACTARDGTPFAASTAATQTMQLAGGAGSGATYTISLTIGTAGRSASTSTVLTVIPGAIPLVAIAGSAVLSGAKANPSQQLVLFANASAFIPGGVTTRWALAAQTGASAPLLNLTDPTVCATAPTSVSMVLRPGALAAGARYTFQLSAVDSVGAVGLANATVTTSALARGGWAEASPASGVALSTSFVLSAVGWTADVDELPLMYSADYVVEGSNAAPVSITGGAYQESPSIALLLPAGLEEAGNVITLRLTVRSAFGATATTSTSVAVAWPVFADAAAVATFVDDATMRASDALQSGDSSTALQVVGGLAQLLNVDSSASQDETAATDQRANLLSIVEAAVSQGGAASVAPAALESTAAIVSQLVAVPSQLSDAAAQSALVVLNTIASAGSSVTPAAAQSVVSALSSVALAPADAAPAGDGQPRNSSATFGAVLAVLTSLATSQSSTLAVPGQAPATVTTATIQMSVGLDDPESSRLFSEPLSAPGSNSSFDKLPSGTLAAAGGAPVNTLFFSLAFDAHGTAQSNNTGGITRLAFTNAATGEPVVVSNLSSPVLFTMPASALAAEQHTTCAWWEDATQAYKTDGCSSLPSPRPPGHELTFVPDFVATGPASLAGTWNVTGPGMEWCELQFLDCSNVTVRASGKLQLGGASTLTCSNLTNDTVLRAFTGPLCSLRDTKNASAPCFWSVQNQTFSGVGCVAANVTRCACTHLTDFTSSPAPNIPVASLADMISLNPADLLTGLKLLFIVVVSLFACLHIGGAVAWVMDSRERALVAEQLRDPACGFRIASDGTCLWRFGLEPLPNEIAAPSGPAVMLAEVLGLPFARLRAALPDELCNTDFATVLGRQHGFSAAGMKAAHEQHDELLRASGRRSSTGDARAPRFSFIMDDADEEGNGAGLPRAPRRSSFQNDGGSDASDADDELRTHRISGFRYSDKGDADASKRPRRSSFYAELVLQSLQSPARRAAMLLQIDAAAADLPAEQAPAVASPTCSEAKAALTDMNVYTALEELTGTAMVIAFLQVTALLPVVEISRMRGAATTYFEELTTPAGWSFEDTTTAFLTLLSPGVLNTRERWWDKARLFKLVLAQNPDGFWDPTSSVAFALEARSRVEMAALKPTWLEQLHDRFSGMRDVAEDMSFTDAGVAPTGGALQQDSSQRAGMPRHSMTRRLSADGLEEVNDDPLWCSPSAVVASMPRRLAGLRKAGGEEVQLERVWATLCCAAFAQSLNVCFLATDGELYPATEATIVDAAYSWIGTHAAKHPPLAAALADGAVATAAARTVAHWHRAWSRRVGELRRAAAFTEHHGTSFAHRASSEIVRAVCTKHSTFAVFLSKPLDGLQRWQSAQRRARAVCVVTCLPAPMLGSVVHAAHRHLHAASGQHLDVLCVPAH